MVTPESEHERSWLGRLKTGLARTSSSLGDGVGSVFARRKLDETTLEELEDLLLSADLGVEVAEDVRRDLSHSYFNRDISTEAVRRIVAGWITKALEPVAKPLAIAPEHKPNLILVVGVNGTGKTTTIGKLARQLRADGKSVALVAADTFRAAAVEQLEAWGERSDCRVLKAAPGADPAALVFEALERERAAATEVMLVDTAGRLHNRDDLMAEIEKICRVVKKVDATAPHGCLLVLDATTGQNALVQVQTFAKTVPVSGLVMTKLDGTARGGVLVAVAKRFKIPIHAVGVGEGIDDLRSFSAPELAQALVGLDN